MSDDKHDSKFLGRRQALQVIGMGFTAAGLLVTGGQALAAPPPKGKPDAGAPAAAGGSCDDKAPIDAQSKTMRGALQYKEKTDDQAKRCDKCVQYEAGKFGACGACKLFTGAVAPAGVCLSFAPIPAK